MKQKKKDEHYLHKTIQHGNVTIRVFRPIFATDQERKEREKEIMSAVGRILSKYPDLGEPVEE